MGEFSPGKGAMTMKRLLLVLLLCMPALALASPGGTDANGGHYNHETGTYHYHHGYPEHLHEGGICPYTGKVWELKIPERPATLAEWQAQQHAKGEVAAIDNQMPETAEDQTAAAPQPEAQRSAVPYAAGGALAAAAAGGAVYAARRKKKKDEEEPEVMTLRSEAVASEPEEPEKENVMPGDTVIGDDGLPWEREAWERYRARKKANPDDNTVATNFAEPKWGRKYSFCTDADGEEIHTMDCELAFIQINAADPHCPQKDCPLCRPRRPDLRWYEAMRAKKEEERNKRAAEGAGA